MKRWCVLILGCLLLAGAGCSAGVPDGPSRPRTRDPVHEQWEVSTPYQRLTAASGETVSLEGWTAQVTARFSAPVEAMQVEPRVAGGTWQVDGAPVQQGNDGVLIRLRADLAGNTPATLTIAGPAPATLTLKPRTPAITAGEAESLTALGREIWGLAAAGDEQGLRAQIAPEGHLSAPGGEFHAQGGGAGLPAILAWAQSRQTPTPVVTVEPRKSYSSLDLILIDTGKGRLAVYVTIPSRRIAKLYGL